MPFFPDREPAPDEAYESDNIEEEPDYIDKECECGRSISPDQIHCADCCRKITTAALFSRDGVTNRYRRED